MAKELPYFKFEPGAWDNGNIQMCSRESKGLFIDLCSMYWSRLGELPYRLCIQKVCAGDKKLLDELINEKLIRIENDKIVIAFLDEQLQELSETREKRVEAGKKGGKNRSLRPDIERIQGRQFYVIHCFNGNEEFIKFGITDDSISRRFSGKMPYQYSALFQLLTDDHLEIETMCEDALKEFKYCPKIEFPGYLECYKIDSIIELSRILKHRTGVALATLNRRNAIREDKIRGDERINAPEVFETKQQAHKEITDNYHDIEKARSILSNRGWVSATDNDVGALLFHFLETNDDATEKPKSEVRQHFKNWINKFDLNELTKLSISISTRFRQRQQA